MTIILNFAGAGYSEIQLAGPVCGRVKKQRQMGAARSQADT